MFKRLLPVALALSALPAWGITTYYQTGGDVTHDETAFSAVAGALGYLNFAAYAALPADPVLTETGTGVIFRGFLNNNSSPANLDVNGTRLEQVFAAATHSTIQVDLPSSLYVIGLHLRTTIGTSGSYCAEAPGTADCLVSLSLSDSATTFFGIISDSPLSDFQFRRAPGSTGGPELAILDFKTTGAVSETPEPSTLGLMGAALISLPLLARRRTALRRRRP
jgi:hypothetical protein